MTDIRFIAKQYLDAGWAVVPLVKGEKRASTSWRTKTYSPSDFGPEDGIALKCGEPSGWRVDVDLDCIEAVEAAKLLLPQTGLIHGRPSKPFSHYWFICKDIKTTQFTEIKSAGSSMIVEVRSTGGYTAVPPSTHPSGENLHWESQRDPMPIEPVALYDCVRDVALAAILARHWQEYGHHAIGPLAGFLTMAGVVEAVRIIEVAAIVAGASADIIRDARTFAETTVAKLRAGQKVTGGPKLAEHLPEALIEKMRGWCKMADVDAIEEMNAKHFFVRIGSKSAIGREDSHDEGVVFQPAKELYVEYANRKIIMGQDDKGKPEIKPLFQAWLESKTRRSYKRVVFSPPPLKTDDTEYNLWKGFAIEPMPGACDLILDHTRDVVCGGNLEHYEYLLDYCAFMVQEPGTPPGIAPVLIGPQGAGKGSFIRVFAHVFGSRHFAHLDRSEELVKWNALIAGKVVVFADEAFFAGDKENTGALKRIITEPTIRIARKHLESNEERNCIHLFMATNEDWAVPAGIGERRFFALRVDPGERGRDYYNALHKEIESGGAAAFLDLLLKRPVTFTQVRDAPRTAELRHQQNQSLPYHLKWLQECLYDGVIAGIKWESVHVPVHQIYEHYKTWVREHTSRFLDKLEFGRQVSKFLTTEKSGARRVGGQVVRCVLLRELDEARAEFDKTLKTTSDWGSTPNATPGGTIAPPNPFAP